MPSTSSSKSSKVSKAKSTKSKATPKKQSTKTMTPTTAPAPVPEPTPEPEPVLESVQAQAVVSEQSSTLPVVNSLESQFLSINTKIANLRSLESEIQSDLRKLQKATMKHIKDLQKKNRKRKVDAADKKKRAPSGFAKPTVISDELCDFLGMTHGTEIARTDVTKQLTKYIKSNELQDEANRRRIIPDKKLSKLLNVGKGQEVTYFNLQKFMKVHFPSSKSQLVESSTA
jgi:chromatin remodeling complex protein RSC6